jgi:hypothetical protein
MYLECRLPNGSSGMAARFMHAQVIKRMKDWAVANDNPFYSITTHADLKLRISFEDTRYYSLFFLSFKQGALGSRFYLVQDS